nr:phosphoenolpyruvate synthase [Nocardia yamanashiensis]
MRVLGPWSDEAELGALGGGKARGLYAMRDNGFQVPEWVALGSDVFDAFAAGSGLDTAIAEFARIDDPDTAVAYAAELRAEVTGAPLPDAVRELIGAACERFGDDPIAVRSSVSAEDGDEHSFAGQFESHLDVRGPDAVIARVRDCWASAFAERAVRYAFARELPRAGAPGVVLQRLVAARASGVLFTANPTSGARDELVISAVYGLGEGLVSGAVDADTVIVDKDGGAVIEIILGDKDIRFDPSGGDGLARREVEAGERGAAVLTDAEIAELTELGRKLEIDRGAPQDIEWAIDDNGVWLLQARPITTLAEPLPGVELRGAGEAIPAGAVRIWDNSNIIESFSGITSPLTYTVAAEIYGRVYRGYAQSLRVPDEQVRQTDEWTPWLLGSFHGRVYYNLLHWYRMVGIAPGYPLNRKVLEAALGVGEPLADDIAKTLRPFTFRSTPARLRSRAITTVTYLRRIAGIDAMMEKFAAEFYRVYDEYDTLDYTALTGEEAYRAYREVDRDLVERWGPMMVLDAMLLTLMGVLFGLTKAFLPKAPESFMYAVMGPGADVESAEPARAMTELAQLVRADAALTELVNSTAPEQIYAALRAGDHPEFLAAVDRYIERYGYRSLDELKLETPDLHEDPASLFIMLRSASSRVGDTVSAGRGGEADAYLDANLGGIRRRIYDRVRAKTSRAAAHRESLRFCRTRAFGMVKRMIRVMGRDLVARGVLDDFPDVFQLTVQELRSCYEGGDTAALREVVAARKSLRARDSGLVAPARFTTVGPGLGRAELAAQGWVPITGTEAAAVGDVLPGTPSAAGVVEGVAVVVDEPLDVAGGILVAYRTDPGWVAALPSASALVIERGSPLTHVAIVARELGVPTVVQVPDVTRRIRTGMRIRVDGAGGTVTVLPEGDAA